MVVIVPSISPFCVESKVRWNPPTLMTNTLPRSLSPLPLPAYLAGQASQRIIIIMPSEDTPEVRQICEEGKQAAFLSPSYLLIWLVFLLSLVTQEFGLGRCTVPGKWGK